ncbi:DUF3969 family protein [Marininema halotolerans]|uniref:DUF3969 family protein n=1 Tax=Marininema halotolerans TaxID=1155944 RepID=A0A1I6U287_9BACL|nr:DUF3969 family protein [Marininema halotolerans]SFS95596.1 Protein of unknown function [Marininema halotolerans]
MRIEITEKVEREQLTLVLCIGFLHALQKGALTLEEVEQYLFSPYTATILEEMGLKKSIIDLIWMGCELEDIQNLIPEKLDVTMSDLINQSVAELCKLKKTSPEKLLR